MDKKLKLFVTEAFQVVFLVSPVFEDFDIQVQEYFFPEEGFDVNTGFRADFFQCGSLMSDDDTFLGIPFHVDHGHDVDAFGFFLEFLHDNLDGIGNFFIVVQ